MISVNNLVFDFVAHDKPFVYKMYAEWDEYCKNVIEPIIDDVLSSSDLDLICREIDKLELNIGNIREEFFFEDFPVRFREELIRALRMVLGSDSKARERVQADAIGMRAEQRLLNIKHYLANGTCEEQRMGEHFRLQTELEIALDNDENGIVRLVQESFVNRMQLERMMLSLDNVIFGRILFTWLESGLVAEGDKRKAISLYAKEYPYLFLLLLEKVNQGGKDLIHLLELPEWERLEYPNIALSLRQNDILVNMMKQLPNTICPKWSAEMKTHIDTDKEKIAVEAGKVMEGGRYQWVMDDRIGVTEKRKRMVEVIRGTPSCLPEFVDAIDRMWQANLLTEIIDENFILELIDILCENQEVTVKTKCWMYASDWILAYMDINSNNLKSLPMDKVLNLKQGGFGEIPQPNISEDAVFASDYTAIGNAGLVLLTPWFPRLFTMLGLLNDDGKEFKNTDSRKRAVFIIQRMVTFEERDYTMMDLIFNRVLVNLPLHESLPSQIQLTEQEIEAVESMLEGVKGNWPNMANTSIKGFQHSFVERKGVLEIQEEKILLTVEPRSYDLLLDSLPWGYKLVRFPWLEKRIHVNWRDKE